MGVPVLKMIPARGPQTGVGAPRGALPPQTPPSGPAGAGRVGLSLVGVRTVGTFWLNFQLFEKNKLQTF